MTTFLSSWIFGPRFMFAKLVSSEMQWESLSLEAWWVMDFCSDTAHLLIALSVASNLIFLIRQDPVGRSVAAQLVLVKRTLIYTTSPCSLWKARFIINTKSQIQWELITYWKCNHTHMFILDEAQSEYMCLVCTNTPSFPSEHNTVFLFYFWIHFRSDRFILHDVYPTMITSHTNGHISC